MTQQQIERVAPWLCDRGQSKRIDFRLRACQEYELAIRPSKPYLNRGMHLGSRVVGVSSSAIIQRADGSRGAVQVGQAGL